MGETGAGLGLCVFRVLGLFISGVFESGRVEA